MSLLEKSVAFEDATHTICNNCTFMCDVEDEEDFLQLVKDEGDFIKACPNCKTDGFLMNVNRSF